MRYCMRCGRGNDDSARFCSGCAPLETAQAPWGPIQSLRAASASFLAILRPVRLNLSYGAPSALPAAPPLGRASLLPCLRAAPAARRRLLCLRRASFRRALLLSPPEIQGGCWAFSWAGWGCTIFTWALPPGRWCSLRSRCWAVCFSGWCCLSLPPSVWRSGDGGGHHDFGGKPSLDANGIPLKD